MSDDFFLHVGTRKTGTTTIQGIAQASGPELSRQGVSLPFGHVNNRFKIANTLERVITDPDTAGVLDEYRSGIRSAPTRASLLSAEQLAALSPAATDRFLDALTGIHTQIVLTARDMSRQIPSDWQQMAKGSEVPDYLDYCRQVERREGEFGDRYHRRFDLPEIARKWGGRLPAEDVHILVLPQRRGDPLWLPREFFGLMGVDLDGLVIPTAETNTSMSFAETNLLRQVVSTMKAEQDLTRKQIHRIVREMWSSPEVRTERPITIPSSMVPWCAEEAQRQIEAIERAGWHVIGNLDDLRVPEDLEPFDPGRLTEEELDVAIARLGDLMAERIATQRRKGGADRPGNGPQRGPGRLPSLIRKRKRRP